ncbi:amidase [Limobrevibacterium gyesilva]|uniref:Amidase n=1 Tax=Limobrevibacterium gyesilva TaxID=2991712 RepID=A0AA41YJW1_9PROT|nr:amidase [Limobrevibacterium gyesilva]MCW3475071.1 amidase [Limobrevibacterium gyesilva]
MTDLPDLSAVELLDAYKAQSLSPVEVTEAVLARIAAFEPALNATWALDPEGARAAARESEARWRRGAPVGALDGVPITIKENIATKGTPVPLGTAANDLVPAAGDAPPAARVRAAGAVILGKTTMPDYGMLSSGLSSFHKLARNPWNTDCNPGGSSAGAGSAAAAGYGPLHLGTDIGGSVRLPAGWCGIVGLKPSFGRVPIDPPYIGRVAGPMTRTVADSALLMEVLSQPDWHDHMSLPPADIAWRALDRDVKGLRIGVLAYPGIGAAAEPEVQAAVAAAARLFEAQGAIVEPVAPFLTPEMLDGLDRFWRTRSWSDYSRLPRERREKVLPFIRAWIEAAEGLSGLEVYRGFNRIIEMSAAAVQACQPYDFIISPTAPMPSYRADWPCPTNDPARPFEHIGFTVAFNMSEQPALSINCGYTAGGLPIGLQIVGHRFDDLGVLQLGRAWERMRPAQRPWPVA